MTKETDIAWLAGIVDGEGCFSIKNPVRRSKPRGRNDGHRKSYWQTDLDMVVLRTLSTVKKHSGEVPVGVHEVLREIIPSEAFLRVEPLRSMRDERLETTRVSLNNTPAHERPTDDEIH